MRPCEAVRGLLKSSSGALGNSWGAIGEPLGCLGCFWGSSWEPRGLPGGPPGGGAAQEKKEKKKNKEIKKKGRKCKPETAPKETPTGHTLVVFHVKSTKKPRKRKLEKTKKSCNSMKQKEYRQPALVGGNSTGPVEEGEA